MKLKKNDNVKIICGKYKGKIGKILQVLPQDNMVVVDGINTRVKHVKPRRNGDKGQKIEFFAPINVSNVMYLTADNKQTRIGYKKLEDGKKVRVMKKTGDTISN